MIINQSWSIQCCIIEIPHSNSFIWLSTELLKYLEAYVNNRLVMFCPPLSSTWTMVPGHVMCADTSVAVPYWRHFYITTCLSKVLDTYINIRTFIRYWNYWPGKRDAKQPAIQIHYHSKSFSLSWSMITILTKSKFTCVTLGSAMLVSCAIIDYLEV